MRIRKSLLFIALLFASFYQTTAWAQTKTPAKDDNNDDLMKIVDNMDSGVSKKVYTAATFKATRVINGQSIENLGAGILDFRIVHRFGSLDQGGRNFYGLDNAVTKLALDYGITKWLMIGLGRSTLNKEYDGFVKVKLLRQTEDNRMPIGVSYVGGTSYEDIIAPTLPAGKEYYTSNRFFYFHQLLIARKFSQRISFQLMPTVVHYNLVPTKADPNNVLAAGIGGRIKLSRRIALTGEYYYTFPGNQLKGVATTSGTQPYHNSLSFGIDIETGGHVFQLIFTNSTGISERTFIGQTTDDWSKGGIHFGFNISRVFTIVKPKEFKDSRNSIY